MTLEQLFCLLLVWTEHTGRKEERKEWSNMELKMWKKKERNLILCNYVTQWMSTCDVKVIYNCYNMVNVYPNNRKTTHIFQFQDLQEKNNLIIARYQYRECVWCGYRFFNFPTLALFFFFSFFHLIKSINYNFFIF